ncbi:hypothetical protein FRC11_012191 [Ceratobasidium sp. 423]|nr:hypothetical protein FRC11_012191 [Ceratobasidium sp. 423]
MTACNDMVLNVSINRDDPSKDPQDSTNEVDPSKLQHNTGVVQSVTAQAIKHMKDWGTTFDDLELASSCQVIPKHGGNVNTQHHSLSSSAPIQPNVDWIYSYLKTPIIPPNVLHEHGGLFHIGMPNSIHAPALHAWHSITSLPPVGQSK